MKLPCSQFCTYRSKIHWTWGRAWGLRMRQHLCTILKHWWISIVIWEKRLDKGKCVFGGNSQSVALFATSHGNSRSVTNFFSDNSHCKNQNYIYTDKSQHSISILNYLQLFWLTQWALFFYCDKDIGTTCCLLIIIAGQHIFASLSMSPTTSITQSCHPRMENLKSFSSCVYIYQQV